MRWHNSHKHPPKQDQHVYYFGPNIGLWVGTYRYEERNVDGVELCPHVFYCDDEFGCCDACDAPFWAPFDPDYEAKGWRPIIPEQYTKLDYS